MTRIAAALPLAEPLAHTGLDTPPSASATLSRHGESLADVAQRTGISESALRTANPSLTPFDALPAGTRVSTPAPTPDTEGPAFDPGDIADLFGRRDTPSPRETLEAIEDLPEPNVRDLPPQLPEADKRQILEHRQATHDAQVVEMAEAALADAEPPQLSDYSALPPATALAEYAMALAQYHADIAALQGALADSRQQQVEATAGFQTLTPEQQQGVRDVLHDPAFQALPLDQQQAIVASMLAGEYYVTDVSAVENHGFNSGEADAVRFDITIDGGTTPVYLPAEPDPALDYHGLDEVANGLVALDPQSRERIERVDVNAQANPADAYWAEEYDMPDFRSYMTAGAEGIVSIYPSEGGTPSQDSLDGGLSHEVGHIVSGQDMGDAEWAAWETAMDADGQSVSDYADASRGEDFAETYKLYMSVIGTPEEAAAREQFPERFAILDEMTGNG